MINSFNNIEDISEVQVKYNSMNNMNNNTNTVSNKSNFILKVLIGEIPALAIVLLIALVSYMIKKNKTQDI